MADDFFLKEQQILNKVFNSTTNKLKVESDSATVDTSTLATSAKQLPDNHQVTVSNPTPAITGFATEAKQTTLESLVETLQELAQRLAPLGSAMTFGAPSLRVTGIAMPSTAVTGPTTSAQEVAALLTLYNNLRVNPNNTLAIQSNINNCIGV